MNQETENKKKLKAFFDKEYGALKSYVGTKIKQSIHQDAEDIIQEVALKLFSGVNGHSPINNVAGFVYRSLKNKIIDNLRKKKHEASDIDEIKLNELAEVLYGTPDNAYSEAMKKELELKIMNLKPVYKEIIIAIDFEGYTYNELSEELEIPIGTLMSRRHRALGILLRKIENKNKK
ncbi:RNA polymerase sigma factor [Tenacibaculum caenipelagi]|uniref:RNA polymerase ECF family sigma subunit n=1 Tax=Tenacibaculum caenipelagi TaxID=1325435 RepID=A0A4R6TF98_9FLAO|nr:RNA polymerase sigma factor [Tenacibaculum caenipelagi]TDQ28638.1 RNA polymerase ECF family sigma subunit [Tenacibaculum caenipelagi]